jgi:hypothetical protein
MNRGIALVAIIATFLMITTTLSFGTDPIPPSSQPGTFSLDATDTFDQIVGPVSAATVYRVHNDNESSRSIKVKVSDNGAEITIDPGDSGDITVPAGKSLSVECVRLEGAETASGTYEVVTT